MNHLIGKQLVEVNYTGIKDAFLLRQHSEELCKSIIAPIAEKLLRQYEMEDEVISIDSIEVNIEVHENEGWLNIAGEKIERELQYQLHSRIGTAERGVVVKKGTEAFFETLIYYLQHGFLPWNAVVAGKEQFETMLGKWIAVVSSNETTSLAEVLRQPQAVHRLVSIVSNNDFVLLTGLLSKNILLNETTGDMMLLAEQIIKQKTTGAKLLLQLKQQVITLLIEKNIGEVFCKKLSAIFYQHRQHFLFDEAAVTEIKTEGLKKMAEEVKKRSENLKSNITKDNKQETESDNELLNEDDSIDEAVETKELSEGVFISNAGAVIIAPFLTQLFKKTGLFEDGKMTNEEKALCLLHYCITGNSNPAEFELVLPKILCGVPVEQVVSISVELDYKSQQQADEMLASVVEHWRVLKNTSIDGLRQSFLQRNGKISFDNDKWVLQVEQKGHDVLLQQLPWGISMIKLLWMKQMLVTEWIH